MVVLPTPTGPRYLRAQPREYIQNNNQDFSGVPNKDIPDPAYDQAPEFLEEQENGLAPISGKYKATF